MKLQTLGVQSKFKYSDYYFTVILKKPIFNSDVFHSKCIPLEVYSVRSGKGTLARIQTKRRPKNKI